MKFFMICLLKCCDFFFTKVELAECLTTEKKYLILYLLRFRSKNRFNLKKIGLTKNLNLIILSTMSSCYFLKNLYSFLEI